MWKYEAADSVENDTAAMLVLLNVLAPNAFAHLYTTFTIQMVARNKQKQFGKNETSNKVHSCGRATVTAT